MHEIRIFFFTNRSCFDSSILASHPCIISLRKGNEMHIQNLAHYIFIIGCVQKTISLPFFIFLPLCSMHTESHNAVHSIWPSISSVRNELEEICFHKFNRLDCRKYFYTKCNKKIVHFYIHDDKWMALAELNVQYKCTSMFEIFIIAYCLFKKQWQFIHHPLINYSILTIVLY